MKSQYIVVLFACSQGMLAENEILTRRHAYFIIIVKKKKKKKKGYMYAKIGKRRNQKTIPTPKTAVGKN